MSNLLRSGRDAVRLQSEDTVTMPDVLPSGRQGPLGND
jgi:hypothetical protein